MPQTIYQYMAQSTKPVARPLKPDKFSTLPTELIISIFERLDCLQEVCRMRRACKRFDAVFQFRRKSILMTHRRRLVEPIKSWYLYMARLQHVDIRLPEISEGDNWVQSIYDSLPFVSGLVGPQLWTHSSTGATGKPTICLPDQCLALTFPRHYSLDCYLAFVYEHRGRRLLAWPLDLFCELVEAHVVRLNMVYLPGYYPFKMQGRLKERCMELGWPNMTEKAQKEATKSVGSSWQCSDTEFDRYLRAHAIVLRGGDGSLGHQLARQEG